MTIEQQEQSTDLGLGFAGIEPDPIIVARMREMLVIQNGLNTAFKGPLWLTKAVAREEIDFRFPILDEAAELLRCDTSWKFWKKPGTPDTENTKIELIDILHFAMSEDLAVQVVFPTVTNFDEERADPEEYHATEELYDRVAESMAVGYQLVSRTGNGQYNVKQIRAGLCTLLSPLTSMYTDVQDDVNGSTISLQPNSTIAWEGFFYATNGAGLSLDDVYLTYKGKAILNAFRVSKDDKSGNYHRTWWDDQEDNYYLMNHLRACVELGQPVDDTSVTAWLTEQYSAYEAELARSQSTN